MNEEKIRRFLNPELPEGYTIYRNLTMYRSKHDDTYTYYADPSRYRWSKHFPTLIVSKYGIFYLLYTEETDPDTITKELDDYYIGFIRQLIKSSPFSLEEKMNTIIIKGFIYAYNLKKDTKYDDLRIVTNPEQIERLIQFNRVPSIPTEYADDVIRKLNIYIQSVFKIKPTRGQIYNIPSVNNSVNNPVSQNSKKSASNLIERIVVLLLIISVFFFIGALLNESFSSERDSAQAKQQEQENTDTNETDDSQTNDTGNAEQPSEESDGNTSYDQQVQQMRDEYNQEVQRQNEEYARRVQEGNANYNQQVQQMQEESARQVQQMQEESAQREQQMQEEYQRNAQNMQ